MISVSLTPRGYAVKLSEPGTGLRGFTVIAEDMKEVHEALDHYYGKDNDNQTLHNRNSRKCPLCRHSEEWSKREMKRMAREEKEEAASLQNELRKLELKRMSLRADANMSATDHNREAFEAFDQQPETEE